MQRELQTLQKPLYRGGKSPAASGTAAPPPAAGFAPNVEIRLGELESLIRGLEQRIETLEIAEYKSTTRLERISADLEHRLRTLEQGRAPRPPSVADVGPAGRTTGRATSIIGGTSAPNAPPRPLGTLVLRKSDRQGIDDASARAGNRIPSSAPILPPGDAKSQYDYALSLILNEQDFAKAEQAFSAFIDGHPKHDLSGNAYFWLGQTHFVRKDFALAAFAFADGFKKYPHSNKAPENLYKLGVSLDRLGKAPEACTAFARLLETYPNTNRTLKTRISRQKKRLKCS